MPELRKRRGAAAAPAVRDASVAATFASAEKQGSSKTQRGSSSTGSVSSGGTEVPAGGAGYRTLLWSCLLLLQLLLAVALLRPAVLRPVAYQMPRPPAFDGPLSANEALAGAERLLEGRVVGAESLAISADGRHIYTGTADGRVVALKVGEQSQPAIAAELLRLRPCPAAASASAGTVYDERKCGRPLGMRVRGDVLYALDAYAGLYRLNLSLASSASFVATAVQHLAGNVTFANDLDVADDGTVYFTDSSSRWPRREYTRLVLEGSADGRLLAYDPATGRTSVIVEGLAFANGLQLTPGGEHALVAETTRGRVLRLHLHGPTRGRMDVFADNLPGLPDNIRLSPRGTYWVGFGAVRGGSPGPSLVDLMPSRPWLRYVAAQLLPVPVLSRIVPRRYGLVAELDASGRIIRTLHDPAGDNVPAVSEVAELADGTLYLGSYAAPYVSRLRLES